MRFGAVLKYLNGLSDLCLKSFDEAGRMPVRTRVVLHCYSFVLPGQRLVNTMLEGLSEQGRCTSVFPNGAPWTRQDCKSHKAIYRE